MKLCDAIALGRMIMEPLPNTLSNPEGTAGCAFGMAAKAMGLRVLEPPFHMLGVTFDATETFDEINETWPWQNEEYPYAVLPCGCGEKVTCYGDIIVHLFDDHYDAVSALEFQIEFWSLDDIITWIRSVEPEEDADIANRWEQPVLAKSEEIASINNT